MLGFNYRTSAPFIMRTAVCLLVLACGQGCTAEQEWKAENDNLIQKHGITVKTRDDIPETGIAPNLKPGEGKTVDLLPVTEIAPGISARMYWHKGALVCLTTLAPDAELPEETLPSERFMIVQKGLVRQLVNDAPVEMKAIEAERMTPVSGRRA